MLASNTKGESVQLEAWLVAVASTLMAALPFALLSCVDASNAAMPTAARSFLMLLTTVQEFCLAHYSAQLRVSLARVIEAR
jgi:hypothetical protein